MLNRTRREREMRGSGVVRFSPELFLTYGIIYSSFSPNQRVICNTRIHGFFEAYPFLSLY